MKVSTVSTAWWCETVLTCARWRLLQQVVFCHARDALDVGGLHRQAQGPGGDGLLFPIPWLHRWSSPASSPFIIV